MLFCNTLKRTGISPEKAFNDLKNGKEVTPVKETEKTVQKTSMGDTFVKNGEREEDGHRFTSERKGVSESLARRAKESRSLLTSYKEGSASAEYNESVERFDKNVNNLIENFGKTNKALTEEDWEEIHNIASRYASNLARYTDEVNKNEASYPAWFVSGAARYNERKNNALMKRSRELYDENENRINPDRNVYLAKIRTILTNSNIKSNDSNAIGKLQDKYDKIKAEVEKGKYLNAYFRKHGTLKGANGISEETAIEFDEKHKKDPYFNSAPLPSYSLQNMNAELRRIKGRIDDINKAKENQAQNQSNPTAATSTYPKVEGVEVNENADIMRVQLRFDKIPSETVRTKLKENGFRWSPKEGAWQRQLTTNGRFATKRVLKEISDNGE